MSKRIQKCLEVTHARTISELSNEFKQEMRRGKAHNAMRLLVSNIKNGSLLLNVETLQQVNQKHPLRHSPDSEVLLTYKLEGVRPIK